MSDTDRINAGIGRAREYNTVIDSGTARTIAAQLMEPRHRATVAFATSGAIDKAELLSELRADAETVDDEARAWVKELRFYLIPQDDRGPVDGWANLWAQS